MKKLISIILSVLIICPLVTGCNGIGKAVEQTNKELTVYESSAYRISDDMANDYRVLYPDVNLNVVKHDNSIDFEERQKKLAAEIMSNNGPDLIIVDKFFWNYSDVSKMMRSGVFANVNEFIKSDKEFNLSDYNQAVMDVGKVGDKQYILPLSYNIPMLLSTEKILNGAGFDISKCKNYWGFTEEIDNYIKTSEQTSPIILTNGWIDLDQFYNYAGINILNYDKKSVAIDSPELKKAAENYKELYPKNKNADFLYDTDEFKHIKAGKTVLGFFGTRSFSPLMSTVNDFYRIKEQPVMFPIRNINGGINATFDQGIGIRNNSPNKQNAYNFAMLMLSKKYQTKKWNQYVAGIPVLNSAIQASYDEYFSKSWKTTNGTETYMTEPFPKKDFELYMSYLKDITEVTVESGAHDKFYQIMKPYFRGEKSYEECIKNAKEQLQIYISE